MPNLPTHINLAQQVANRLGHDTLESNLGYFFLGSTSPDIRVITRMSRELYHFAPLDFEVIGTGVHTMFESNPHLLPAADHSKPTQAFMAGYITHLLADENWIVNMFRPYFGNTDVFEDEALGKVMDRAMQLEMDRRCWDSVDAVGGLLESPTDLINIGFIESETLSEWAQWILGSLERGFSWERLRFMARRIAEGDEAHPAFELVEEFVQDVPGSMERMHQFVPQNSIEEYHEIALESLVKAVEDYLP